MQVRMKAILILMCSVALIVNGCGTLIPKQRADRLGNKNISELIDVVIDDANVKNQSSGYGSAFVSELESILSKNFRHVIVRSNYTSPKPGELLIKLNSVFLTESSRADTSLASTRVTATILNNAYDVAGDGAYDLTPDMMMIIMTIVPTVFVSMIASFIYPSYFARNNSIYNAATKLSNAIVSRQVELVAFAQNALLQKTSPANLILTAKFTDSTSFLTNNVLDAGESAELIVTVKNSGKGTGFATELNISTNSSKLSYDKEITIGDIPPGESQEVRVLVKAGLDITDGKTEFLLDVTEKRKYDSNKVKLNVNTTKLEKPKLEIVSTEIEDSNIGLAKGNGNHVIESGETVELTAFIRNSGVGPALGVNLVGSDMTSGVTWLSGHDTTFVGTIAPGETAKAKLAFSVPPNFDAKNIAANLKVADVRPIDKAEYQFAQGYSKKSPDLQYAYQIYSKGLKIATITNGGEYEVELNINNNGQMAAKNVVVNVAAASGSGINISRSKMDIGEVKEKGVAQPQRFTLSVPRTYSTNQAPLSIEIAQAYFPSARTNVQIPVDVKSPNLSYTANLRSKNQGNTLEQREQAVLEVQVINNGTLTAEGVKIALVTTDEDLELPGQKEAIVGTIPAGASADIVKFPVSAKPRLRVGAAQLGVNITQNEFASFNKQYALNILEEGATIIDVAGDSRSKTAVAASSQAGPKITIKGAVSLAAASMVEEDTYRLAFEVGDSRAISMIKVLVNGRAIADVDRSIAQTITTAKNKTKMTILLPEVPLDEGLNTIQIIAYNADNSRSAPQEIKITRAMEKDVETPPITGLNKKNAIAVVIGISKQEDKGTVGAAYAKKDALKMYDYLINQLGYSKANIFLVTDEEARVPYLKTLFSKRLQTKVMEKRGAPDTEVFVYYSGHGYPVGDERYLLTYDYNPQDVTRSAYPVRELFEETAKLNVKTTIVLDACYSGSSGSGEQLVKGTSAAVMQTKNPADRIKKGIVFTAAASEQYANWYDEKQHGLFTYYFLQGIGGSADRNNDEKITVGELKEYISAKVILQSQKKGDTYRQTPEVKGDDDAVMVEAYR